MKKLLLSVAVLLLAASTVTALNVTCTVSAQNAKQARLLADFLADINAHPPEFAPVPFATFDAYCSWNAKNEVLQFTAQREAIDAAQVGAKASAHGDETAPTQQCTAASLPGGCTKAQVACFVLSGNTTCK